MKRPSQPAISPDGKRIAYVVSRYTARPYLLCKRVYVAPTDAPAEARAISDSDVEADTPVWSPDSTRLLFRARPSPLDVMQLYVRRVADALGRDVLDEPAKRLTALPFHPWAPKWRWSRDAGDLIFFMGAFGGIQAGDQAYLSYESPLVGWWDNLRLPQRNWRIFVIRLDRPEDMRDVLGAVRPLLDFVTGLWDCWDVSHDGSEIVFCAHVEPDAKLDASQHAEVVSSPKVRREINLDIVRLTRKDGACHIVTKPNQFDDYKPVYSPDGKRIVYAEKQFSALLADYPKLKCFTPASGDKATEQSEQSEDSEEQSGPLPVLWRFIDNDTVAVVTEEGGRQRLRTVKVDSLAADGEPKAATCSACGQSVHDCSVWEDTALCVESSFVAPPELYLRTGHSETGAYCDFAAWSTELNQGLQQRLKSLVRVSSKKLAKYPASQMYVIRPNDPATIPPPYPLVLMLHGGPNGAWLNEFNPRFNASLLASHGYVVCALNFRGSTGTSESFAKMTLGNWSAPLEDVEDATDQLVSDGYVDGERMAILGGSYGAFLGARLLTLPDSCFKAAVLHAGVYDPIQHFASDAYWVQTHNFGRSPWDDASSDSPADQSRGGDDWTRFANVSPLRAAKFPDEHKPSVLLTHGLNDLRVSWTQSVLLHRMLLDQGATSRLLLFPGVGHRIETPEASIQWWREVLAWLAKHLAVTTKQASPGSA